MEIVKKSKQQLEGSNTVFFGSVTQKDNKGKYLKFTVSNHLEEGVEYKFRYTCKCRAGFLNINNQTATPEQFISSTYAFLDNVQVLKKFDDGTEHWFNVLTTKGGKFHSIDKAFLNHLKVTHMHNAWKKMVDYDLWKNMNTKTHASYAYKINK
jgi:predicted small integral membrane protein